MTKLRTMDVFEQLASKNSRAAELLAQLKKEG